MPRQSELPCRFETIVRGLDEAGPSRIQASTEKFPGPRSKSLLTTPLVPCPASNWTPRPTVPGVGAPEQELVRPLRTSSAIPNAGESKGYQALIHGGGGTHPDAAGCQLP